MGANVLAMRQGACVALSLILFVLLEPSAVSAETLRGKVEIKTPIRKVVRRNRRQPLRSNQDDRSYTDRSGSKSESRDEVRSVVVSVVNAPAKKSSVPAIMRQKDRSFIPFVLPVVVGTKVEFPNDDKIYHGVYSESKARAFELPQYANGESRSLVFEKPGVVELFCHIHAHMNAFIVILENGFFAQPGSDHAYAIKELPPGRYTVKAWHPRLGSKVEMVEVKAGQDASLDFTF